MFSLCYSNDQKGFLFLLLKNSFFLLWDNMNKVFFYDLKGQIIVEHFLDTLILVAYYITTFHKLQRDN